MTTRRKGEYRHLELFDSRDWGLIIYDEVHLLPAPIFRLTADLQSRRRLGLTATLIREDGREGDVFSLIGPKRYDAPWKDIENQGWIAPADCTEVRVTLTDAERMAYATAEPEDRYKLAATARTKLPVIARDRRPAPGRAGAGDRRLPRPARRRRRPSSTARRSSRARPPTRSASGSSTRSAAARCACWWSPRWRTSPSTCPRRRWRSRSRGTFGSRQEEAQRLGRVLRPKADGRQAHFYTVVARDTLDAEYAAHRQRFLAEQGYAYTIVDADDLLRPL